MGNSGCLYGISYTCSRSGHFDFSRNWIINDLRLNPQLLSEVQLDETDEQLLFDMMWETKKYLNQNSALISEIVHRLK